MSPEQDELICKSIVMQQIIDNPKAAMIAADELRRDPLPEDREAKRNYLLETYGEEVVDRYDYLGMVIAEKARPAFALIDFGAEVDQAISRDPEQMGLEQRLTQGLFRLNNRNPEQAEVKVGMSRRSLTIFYAAKLISQKQVQISEADQSLMDDPEIAI
jgi:hypothetical protein